MELNPGLPEEFSLYSETLDTTNRWWETFQSPELSALIDEALRNSPSIQQAWARLAQAEAVTAQTGAERLPSVGYSARGEATRFSNIDTSVESYSFSLPAMYEVDLWGRIKSQTEAAELDRKASREQLNTAAITLSSQVGINWIGILAQRLQIVVIHKQLEVNQTSLKLIELRFRKSLSSALDIYQQRQTVFGTKSRIPLAELREELLFNELAALLGMLNFDAVHISQIQLPILGTLPSIGIPADVLANRPDVRAAGLQLYSADWQVSAARAGRLPAIRLTGSLDYGSSNVTDLFDDWAANLAASITGPIFDGGRRKAEVVRTRAVADERLAAYRETVINAIKEVEDSLVSEQKQREFIGLLEKQLEAARRSHEESVNRYRNGLIEYTTVLIQLNTLQTLERDRVEAQLNLLQYRINLYRALGGSWPSELEKS